MSSLRNAVKRKTHKERSQPGFRSKYGLLEKHKDYVLRAKDFHRKEQQLKSLQEKAAFRNPDEFYFKMINSRLVNGKHRHINIKQFTPEELLLIKTQDFRYVLNKAQAERKKVESLQSVLHHTAQASSNTHVYFASDRNEAAQIVPAVETNTLNPTPKRLKKKQEAAYRELVERRERAEKLKNMAMTMTLHKQLMGKGRKRKISEVGEGGEAESSQPPVYRWKQERKR